VLVAGGLVAGSLFPYFLISDSYHLRAPTQRFVFQNKKRNNQTMMLNSRFASTGRRIMASAVQKRHMGGGG
jgi:hypothetical protein